MTQLEIPCSRARIVEAGQRVCSSSLGQGSRMEGWTRRPGILEPVHQWQLVGLGHQRSAGETRYTDI